MATFEICVLTVGDSPRDYETTTVEADAIHVEGLGYLCATKRPTGDFNKNAPEVVLLVSPGRWRSAKKVK